MRLVYAIGQLGELRFAIAASRNFVPAGAIIFAICSEDRELTIQDEDLLDGMIEREHTTFQRFLRKAREMETKCKPFLNSVTARLRFDDVHDKFAIATNFR